jgi:CHAD domain-containing protein
MEATDRRPETPAMPLSTLARTSVEDLAGRLKAERLHGAHVAGLARQLFDATHVLFGVPQSDGDLLEAACHLHDAGYALNPRKHAEAAAELVGRNGLPGLSSADSKAIAALIRLHPRSVGLAEARAVARRAGDPRRILYSAALLRIADALDFGHLQDAEVGSVRATNRRIRIGIRSPLCPANLDDARRQFNLWREVFPADIDFRLLRSRRKVPLVTASTPVHEAVRRLLFAQHRIVLANVEGALDGAGQEPLHDLRIAIRRMRTVIRAFRKPLRSTSAERVQEDLQRLNRILGIARDLDVWIGFFSDTAVSSRFARNRLWPRFMAHQLELRRLQQTTVRRHLHGSGFIALRFRIERLLRVELPSAAAAAPPVAIAGPARRALSKSLRQAAKLGHLRQSDSPDKIHRLRIALRRVRYLAAFFSGILSHPVKRLGRRAHAIERILGEVRDAHLALDRIQGQGPTPPRLLVRQLERLRRRDAAALDRAWDRLEEPKFRGELERELAR